MSYNFHMFPYLARVCLSLSIVRSYANNDNLNLLDSGYSCDLGSNANCKSIGDGADYHILLQKVAIDVVNDHTSTDDAVARRSGIHLVWRNAQPKYRESENAIWTHPLVLGILLGLFSIGPDHLGTLMALSTLTSGYDSFKRGFYWGVGHSIGVVLLCPIFLALEHITSKTIPTEAWEYYGDIFIGISMIIVGMYFFAYQDTYLQQREDGSYEAKACRCNWLPNRTSDETYHYTIDENVCSPCRPEFQGLVVPNSRTIASEEWIDHTTSAWQFVNNSLLGLLQGLCCPLGVTAGTGFMSRITATASTPMLVAFVVVFAIASGVVSGLISLGWGALTLSGSSCISGRVVYMATCLLLVLFGVVWLVAHSLGLLYHVDFAGKIHQGLVPSIF